nr:hypothetical protein [Gammaproteobacteria bacterium]
EEITADEITYEEPEAAVTDSSGDSAINVEAADAPEPEASLAEIEPTADQTLMDDLTAHESTAIEIDSIDVDLGDDAALDAEQLSTSGQSVKEQSMTDTVH